MDGGGFSRRTALIGGAALVAGGAAATGPAFSWGWLKAHALAAAARPYQPQPVRTAAAAIGYDDRDAVIYRADRELPGGIRLFPVWKLSPTPVEINVVEGGRARPITFSRDVFEGGNHIPAGAEGFSGFRVMTPDRASDWLAFQGASYFRSAGALDQYGLSMRALALDTGLATPEEFPAFTRFWLEAGPAGAITVYALLEGPSVSGAWRFVNRRGLGGVTQEVSFVFRLRRDVARLGLAPATSMFWYGEGNRAQAIDWRPEIHDSDGLALHTGAGERLWRPLNDPSASAGTSSFVDRDPRGYGLLQRDRAFDHYQDDGVWYDRRPSLWVEPIGRWGAGSVMLVELPTQAETNDNIVAFWSPAAPARAGFRMEGAYRLHWTAQEPAPAPSARVTDSWRGVAGPPGSTPLPGATRLVSDFAGPGLAGLDEASGVVPEVSLSRGTPVHVVAYRLAGAGDRWRLIVDVTDPVGTPLELRACLRRGGDALTETLLYQFLPGDHR